MECQCDHHLSKLAGIYMRAEGEGAAVEENQGRCQCTADPLGRRAGLKQSDQGEIYMACDFVDAT